MDKSKSQEFVYFSLLAFFSVITLGVAGLILFGNLLVALVTAFSCILLFLLKILSFLKKEFNQVNRNNRRHYQQLEALLSLSHFLPINAPLPPMRGWAASPDFLLKIAETILLEKPALILEASSGVSTLISAYCLKHLGTGKVFSLEHDLKFAEKTKQLIKQHGLEEYVEILHAPLSPVNINGKSWQWYALDVLEEISTIDLLIIDGPPKKVQKNSRYPAVPLLYEKLKNACVILLDDGARSDETQTVESWKGQFRFDKAEFIDSEKGTWALKAATTSPD